MLTFAITAKPNSAEPLNGGELCNGTMRYNMLCKMSLKSYGAYILSFKAEKQLFILLVAPKIGEYKLVESYFSFRFVFVLFGRCVFNSDAIRACSTSI